MEDGLARGNEDVTIKVQPMDGEVKSPTSKIQSLCETKYSFTRA